ncbi:MarR family winged helix-turn-helix transcriptional regulator [Pseudomonas chlororaphis]|uniref:MarR family winged helix-turn-helix transcriptional regulator n=1 Tax=Pseudomonas chlororaphis TaxID=587753 RepID=UPI0015DF0944|nr:MarR family transcriptional regulator [Pseudomonas chlororaphis]QLL16100.1 MarR family transcriptional regulator [Pseudomonas chlororaphis subsp. aurantiaca]
MKRHDSTSGDASRLRGQIMAVVRRLRRETRGGSIPLAQLALLGAIDRFAGEATPSALAATEQMRSPNLASQLRALEGMGLIQRTPDAQDRRKVRVSLTEDGREALHRNRIGRDEWLAATMLACLTPQEQQLLADAGMLLERIAKFENPSTHDKLEQP